MTTRVWTDRSRIETFQRCNRLRYLEYHQDGQGITSARKPLPLAVGGSVHAGLATLLTETMRGFPSPDVMEAVEEHAVKMALIDFAEFQAALDIGEEQFEMTKQLDAALAAKDSELAGIAAETISKGRSEFEQWLYHEQASLVEALVRAYARRRLKPLLEQYEVLEVEREGSWKLSDIWSELQESYQASDVYHRESLGELWFMSRPDAILRERDSNQLYILSFKTAAKWDRRKAEDAKRDMQGLSEGVEVEKRLGRIWHAIHDAQGTATDCLEDVEGTSKTVINYLQDLSAAPRIMGIRYEYMLKGDRWLDKDLSSQLGLDVRTQRSPLIRGYANPGMAVGDEQWNVSWEYVKEGGEASKLYYKNWKSSPVYLSMPIKKWIDMLDQTVEAVGEEGVAKGWSSPAQATGFLEQHPLDEIFIPPIIQYRNDDELRDWVEQVEAQEVRVAGAIATVQAATDEGERRHLLNVHFPMSRRACEYPTTCSCVRICYGGEEIRKDPLGSGLYKIRTANHPQEVQDAKS